MFIYFKCEFYIEREGETETEFKDFQMPHIYPYRVGIKNMFSLRNSSGLEFVTYFGKENYNYEHVSKSRPNQRLKIII